MYNGLQCLPGCSNREDSGKTIGKRRYMLLFFIIMSLTVFICSGADEKCLNENTPKRDAAVRVKLNKF